MKILLVASFLIVGAMSAPLEDTPEVKEAKATFQAAFDKATVGEHAKLAPAPVVSSYLADAKDVADAKKEFNTLYKNAESGSKVAGHPVVPIAYPYYSVVPSFNGFTYSSVNPAHVPLYYSGAPFAAAAAATTYNGLYHYPSPYHHYYTYPYANTFVRDMNTVEEPAVQVE